MVDVHAGRQHKSHSSDVNAPASAVAPAVIAAPANSQAPDTLFSRAWQIYDEHRTALFNSRYFEKKVTQIQTSSLLLDIVIAIGTSTTGIAGWALWNEAGFKVIWIIVAGVAGTLAVVKPILNLQDRLVKVTKLFGEYGQLASRYNDLVGDMGAQHSIDDAILSRFHELRKTAKGIELVPQGPKGLLEEVQKDVNREWPITRYWSPPKLAHPGA